MAKELAANSAAIPESGEEHPQQLEAKVLLLGGVGAESGALPVIGTDLAATVAAQDLRIGALHSGDAAAAAWLMQAGVGLIALAGMRRNSEDASSIGLIGVDGIGAGETVALANRPVVLCINGVRIGVLSYGEQLAGEFSGRADILSLSAYDQVRTLLNQCDHVVVLVRAGLTGAELPLPEWRARYRRFIDAGASVVADTGSVKGWEAYKNGLVFYGLGSAQDVDSLGLFLTLRQNGRLDYEARALEQTSGKLDFSQNDSFKSSMNAQNALLTDEAAYLRAANQMCLRYYSEHEQPQKRGMFSALRPQSNEEEKLLSLLKNESRQLAVRRALANRSQRETTR